MSIEDRKKELHNLVEEMASPIDSIHEAYKEKMKKIILIFSGYLVTLLSEKSNCSEKDIIKLVDEFVEKSFKKAE